MQDHGLFCWKCGAPLGDLPLPLSRLAECRACGTPLHVCRMCRFYDPALARGCREPVAEEVRDRERANFCGYFEPRKGPPPASGTKNARAALDALFGGPAAAPKPANPLDDLFDQR